MQRLLVLFVVALALSPVATAQTYPERPIRLIVPFAPGGSADAAARPVAEKLASALGQPIVVENRGGGLTVIGADLAAKAAPDGYTLFIMPGAHVLSPRLVKNVPFDPIRDFTPISMIAYIPFVVFSDAKLPFTTMKEMIGYAKANPGKLSVGTTDAVGRLALESLRNTAGLDITQINYKSAATLASDVAGSHIHMGILTPPAVLGFWRDKRIHALALTGPNRIESMPDVLPVAESAGIAGYSIQTWFALTGPAGMPAPVVDRLQREMQKILGDPEVRSKLQALGMDPATDASPARVSATMKGDSERLGKLLEQSGIKPE